MRRRIASLASSESLLAVICDGYVNRTQVLGKSRKATDKSKESIARQQSDASHTCNCTAHKIMPGQICIHFLHMLTAKSFAVALTLLTA